MIDTDPRDLIERMCACLHGWSVLWGPAANSPTRLLVDEARHYLAQSEFKPPSLKEQALEALRSTPCTEQRHYDALFVALNRLAELEDSND